MMYDSAGTSVSKVGAGACATGAFGCGFGVVGRFCCAVAVSVIRINRTTTVGYLFFMGVRPRFDPFKLCLVWLEYYSRDRRLFSKLFGHLHSSKIGRASFAASEPWAFFR